MPSNPTHLYPGLSTWKNQVGATVLRLDFTADPEKNAGEKIWVPELNMDLSPWAYGEFKKIGNAGLFKQEYLVDGSATQGQLIYHLDEEATLEDSFPIPEEWTRYYGLDPHPAVAHAHLWCAVDPWGDRWYYRELWPSKVCFRYEGANLVGKAGSCPEDDFRFTIREHVQTVKYLEFGENPQNRDANGRKFDEPIYDRVIDYAARAFGKGTNDDPDQPNFQQRYEKWMLEEGLDTPRFKDAKKDHEVGYEIVNAGLRPREVMGADGKYHKKSKIHIFKDRCPELIYQLKNVRRQQLTAEQAAKQDPTGKVIAVRNHMVDILRYLECSPLDFVR